MLKINALVAVPVVIFSLYGCAATPTSEHTIFSYEKNSDHPENQPPTTVKKNRLDLDVGYTGVRGANIQATFTGEFDDSILNVNALAAFSEQSINAQHIFDTKNLFNSEKSYALGYSASYRDFQIVPNDSTTQNTQASASAIFLTTLSPTENIIYSLGAEQIKSKTGMAGDTGKQTMFPATLTYNLDERVDKKFPTQGAGYYIKTKVEASVLGESYAKAMTRTQFDIPLNELLGNFSLSIKSYVGVGKSFSNLDIPVTKRFFLEDGVLVRGYAANAFGYNNNGAPVGSSLIATGALEIWMPLFHDDLRAYTFFDTGLMRGYGSDTGLKKSIGGGISWASPIGVISISYAKALEKNAEFKQSIGFNLGINY